MKKFLSTLLISALILPASSSLVTASPIEIQQMTESEYENKTNHILTTIKNQEERLNRLKEIGWEVVPNEEENIVFSRPGSGKITNYLLKSSSQPGKYMVQAVWDFVETNQWDNTGHNAPDIIALSVVDQNDKAVNAQAENAGIVVQDENFTSYDNYGTTESYANSGVTYRFRDVNTSNNLIGKNGYAWFYISKPNSGTRYYIKSQWTHTWSSSSLSLISATIGYPFALSVSWANNQTPNQWVTSDQDQITFN